MEPSIHNSQNRMKTVGSSSGIKYEFNGSLLSRQDSFDGNYFSIEMNT
jgi:hypothetical protein